MASTLMDIFVADTVAIFPLSSCWGGGELLKSASVPGGPVVVYRYLVRHSEVLFVWDRTTIGGRPNMPTRLDTWYVLCVIQSRRNAMYDIIDLPLARQE